MKQTKYIFFFILLSGFLLFNACEKEPIIDEPEQPINIDTVQMMQQIGWTTENFKTNYDIQFPANYEGNGMVGFEGNFFNKNRTDDAIKVTYNFCGPLFCTDFGDSLTTPLPSTITLDSGTVNAVSLTERLDYYNGTDVFGVFYHDTTSAAIGKFYMYADTAYLEAATVEFDYSELTEVINIIGTVKEK